MTESSEREERFGALFNAHVAQVRGFSRTMVNGADCEDIVSATFRTAWLRLDEIPELGQRAWLFGVAKNHVRNHVRSERRRAALIGLLGSLASTSEAGLHSGRLDPAEAGPLLKALERLSEAEREILQLAIWHEMQPAEIAAVFGIRPATARVRLHRARQHLLALLQSLAGEDASHV